MTAARTQYLDRKAPRGKALRYWIQVVNADGRGSGTGRLVRFRTSLASRAR